MAVHLQAICARICLVPALAILSVNLWTQPADTLPPVTTQVLVGNISAAVVTSFLPVPAAVRSYTTLRATADMGELQTKLWPILRERLETSGACGRKVSVRSARLVPSNPSSTLDLSIHTEDAACVSVPKPAPPVVHDTEIRMRLLPSAAGIHLNLEVQIASVSDNGTAADVLGRLRTLIPQVLFGHIQPDAPENGIPTFLAKSASIENLRFVDLGGNRLGLEGEVTLPAAAMTAARMLLQGRTNAAAALPPRVTERNLQVGFSRWPVDGTLTLPSGEGPVPAVLVMRGETVLDRDGSIQFDKPLRDYAWGLAARGIAVLRYDLRRWSYAASMAKANEPIDPEQDIVADAQSALRTLRTLPRIRQDRVFILGVGDAGALSPRAALVAPPVRGLILISASARMRWEIISLIAKRTLDDANAPPAQKQTAAEMAELATLLKSTPVDRWTSSRGNMPASYWRFWQAYNPGSEAAKFKNSVLLVFGSKDEPLFEPEWARWQEAVGGRPHMTRKVFPELTPLLQPAPPATPRSGFPPPRPVSPAALDFIANWIVAQ